MLPADSIESNRSPVGDSTLSAAAQSLSAVDSPCCPVIPEVRRTGVRRRWLPILLTGGAVLVAYSAVQRFSTHANADRISSIANLAGGFLAIGISDAEPGFIVLSAMDRERVSVSADQANSVATGTSTTIEIRTPREHWSTRLRTPQVVIVSEDGRISPHTVQWSLADFQAIDRATDCDHPAPSGRHRCGAPFADLYDVAKAKRLHAPDDVYAFLEPHGGQ